MNSWESHIQDAEKKANLQTDPCLWMYFVHFSSPLAGFEVRDRESLIRDSEALIAEGAEIRNVVTDSALLFRNLFHQQWDAEKTLARMEQFRLAGADLDWGLIHLPNTNDRVKYLPYFFQHGASLPPGCLSNFLHIHDSDQANENRVARVLQARFTFLLEHSSFRPNEEDLRFLCQVPELVLIALDHGVDMVDLDVKPGVLRKIYTRDVNRRANIEPSAKELIERLLDAGADPNNGGYCPSPKAIPEFLAILFQYGRTNINHDERRCDKKLECEERIAEIRDANPCIHWCNLAAPWSIQRLLWIPDSPFGLLPSEIILDIARRCGDLHITYSERAQLKRKRSLLVEK